MDREKLLNKARLYVYKLSQGTDPITGKQCVVNGRESKLLNCFSDLSVIFDEIFKNNDNNDTVLKLKPFDITEDETK